MSKRKLWFITMMFYLIVIATGLICLGSDYTFNNGAKPIDLFNGIIYGYAFGTMPFRFYAWLKGNEGKEK